MQLSVGEFDELEGILNLFIEEFCKELFLYIFLKQEGTMFRIPESLLDIIKGFAVSYQMEKKLLRCLSLLFMREKTRINKKLLNI